MPLIQQCSRWNNNNNASKGIFLPESEHAQKGKNSLAAASNYTDYTAEMSFPERKRSFLPGARGILELPGKCAAVRDSFSFFSSFVTLSFVRNSVAV